MSDPTGRILPAASKVVRAWVNPGPRPDTHYEEVDRLRRHWPALARALEELADAYR